VLVPSKRVLPFDPVEEAGRQWSARWPAADAMAVTTSIMRVQQLLLARVDDALRPFNLTFARYEALVLLLFSRRGSLPMSRMGERLMIHPTSVTNIVDRLEGQRLVRRVPHPSDRRTTIVEITEAGRSVGESATEALTAIRFGLDGLGGPALSTLYDLLRQVRVGSGDLAAPAAEAPGLTAFTDR
jgi:DNA-binding MarR family transcriptional regulator